MDPSKPDAIGSGRRRPATDHRRFADDCAEIHNTWFTLSCESVPAATGPAPRVNRISTSMAQSREVPCDEGEGSAMYRKSILAIGAIAIIGTLATAAPVRAEGIGLFASAGIGVGVGVGHDDGFAWPWLRETRPAGTSLRYVGVPGYQRPVDVWVPGRPGRRVPVAALGLPYEGPDRKTVCGWQERYDRHEHYIGSQRICWIEAR